jgi:hypothetical protein
VEDPALFVGELQIAGVPVAAEEPEVRDFVRPPSRSAAFSVRLSPEERALVEAAASRCEPRLAAGTWAKTALVDAARRLLDERTR